VLLDREGQIRPEPYGAPIPFEIPLTPQEREDLRWYLEDYLEAPYAVYKDRGSTIAGKIPQWGRRLFDAVFGPGKPGRDAYSQALQKLSQAEFAELRDWVLEKDRERRIRHDASTPPDPGADGGRQ
jgi:hypothetical protein